MDRRIQMHLHSDRTHFARICQSKCGAVHFTVSFRPLPGRHRAAESVAREPLLREQHLFHQVVLYDKVTVNKHSPQPLALIDSFTGS